MDFTGFMAPELLQMVERERKSQRDGRKWHRILREFRQADKLATTAAINPPPARPGGLAGAHGK